MPTLQENFRRNLRELRESKDLSQEELAYECGLDRTYIGKIERGSREPSLSTINLICDVLECRPDELFQDIDPVHS